MHGNEKVFTGNWKFVPNLTTAVTLAKSSEVKTYKWYEITHLFAHLFMHHRMPFSRLLLSWGVWGLMMMEGGCQSWWRPREGTLKKSWMLFTPATEEPANGQHSMLTCCYNIPVCYQNFGTLDYCIVGNCMFHFRTNNFFNRVSSLFQTVHVLMAIEKSTGETGGGSTSGLRKRFLDTLAALLKLQKVYVITGVCVYK